MGAATSQRRERWAAAADRLGSYALLEIGDASFVCKAADCAAHCCKVFSVSLGEAEVGRLASATGWPPARFLESEDGRPLALPLAQPYLLKRRGRGCGLLGDDLLCGVYDGRPDACRLYPHFVLLLSREGGPVQPDAESLASALAAAATGDAHEPAAVLVRHLACPGFTGPPLDEAAWLALLRETARLQYGESLAAMRPPATP
ncbi:MAG: YkgJ family cysteine cluster protein [Dehalococcoidia bacterium]|nr:YkgJ family cysteine cluster protein [Dehalococcoidia bacterium]